MGVNVSFGSQGFSYAGGAGGTAQGNVYKEPTPLSRLDDAVQNVNGAVSELEYVLIDLEKKLSRVLDASTTTIGADKADQQTKDNSITSDVNSASARISALYHRTQNIIDRLHV